MLRVRVKSPVQLTVFTFAAKWRSGAAANAGEKRAAKGAGRLLASAGRALRATRRRAAVRANMFFGGGRGGKFNGVFAVGTQIFDLECRRFAEPSYGGR
jgi:hypothetical protein